MNTKIDIDIYQEYIKNSGIILKEIDTLDKPRPRALFCETHLWVPFDFLI